MNNKYYYDNYDPELEESLKEPLLPTPMDELRSGLFISFWMFWIIVFFFS